MDYKKVWEYLKGKKSYLIAGLFIIVAGLKGEGFITPDQYDIIVTVLGAMGLASLRHGIQNRK